MKILDKIPVDFNRKKIQKELHMDKQDSSIDKLQKILDKASSVAQPKALYKVSYVDRLEEDKVIIEGTEFESRVLRDNLENVGRVFPYVATCGMELDQIEISDGGMVEDYMLDVVKAQALEMARDFLREQIENKYEIDNLSSMGPGTGQEGIWGLEQQEGLFSLLGDVESRIGVELTDTYVMRPNKSVSEIYFATKVSFESCQLCRREDCPNRKVAFDESLAEEYGI